MKNQEVKKHSTDDLVAKLSRELNKPSESRDWSTQYWFSWVSCFSIMALLTYVAAAAFPAYLHMPNLAESFTFWFDTGLWFCIAFLAAFLAYQNSRPGAATSKLQWAALSALVLILISTAIRTSPSAMAAEFPVEMDVMRGRCGMFILVTGALALSWMCYVMKRAAPTQLSQTGLWGALSVGALGSMFMHLVCTHENSLHVFIWHVTPLFLLTAVAASLGQKLLRW